MYLTLEVVSPQAASLGAQRRQVVGVKGLTIGRLPGNDWIIPDPYISKQHARISYADGGFFVEGLGRNPIAIGSAQNAIPGKQRQPLKNGDRLFIDQYEILVSTQQGDPPGAASPAEAGDPFGVIDSGASYDPFESAQPLSPNPAHARDPFIPDVWDGGGVSNAVSDTGELDPLAALGGGAPPAEPELPPVHWQQASPLGDHFQPPSARASASPGVPDNWDRSLLTPPPPPQPAVPVAPTPSGIPDNWDRSVLGAGRGGQPQTPAPPSPAAPLRQVAPPPPAARRTSPQDVLPRRLSSGSAAAVPAPEPQTPRRGSADDRQPIERRAEPRPAPVSASPAVPRVEVAPPGPKPSLARAPANFDRDSTVGTDLAQLLSGAGLAGRDVSPELVSELGTVLRIVVQGVMEVLQARTEIKSQFRLPLTRVKANENNPLKLSPNVESALHMLLVQRNAGYVSAVQAFEDAFTDIRNHQMAMLEGMRVAFESMLRSFDPRELEKEFEGRRAGRLGFGGGRSRFWDLYVERFTHLGGDADDTFRRLFGDVFAEAYERQLERLKQAGDEGSRN